MALVLQNHCIVGYGDFSLMWSSPVLNLDRGKSRSSRAFIVCFSKSTGEPGKNAMRFLNHQKSIISTLLEHQVP